MGRGGWRVLGSGGFREGGLESRGRERWVWDGGVGVGGFGVGDLESGGGVEDSGSRGLGSGGWGRVK